MKYTFVNKISSTNHWYMSNSTNSEKFKPLSVYNRSAMRTKAAEKALDASNHIPTSNSEPTNIQDRHKLIPDDKVKILILRAECYNLTNFKLLI